MTPSANNDSTLFVLLGAGASYDALANPSDDIRPPLTKHLFSHPRSAEKLMEYPLALNAAPQIRDAISGGEPASSLEDYLRDRIAESKDEYDQRRLLSIELYLQDLLLSFAGHAAQADNYRRLVNPLLARHRHVCFITLNYDILLDLCLQPFDPLDDINDFIAHERWSLIKPHGSATWGREVPINAGPGWAMTSPAQVFRSPPAKLIDVLKDEILHRWTTSVGEVRGADGALNVLGRFPALSVPLGSEDKLVCPGTHLNFLTDKLEAVGTYDLLVIGYSGLDRSVLGLLTATSAKPRSVYVVDAGFDQALASAERLARAFGDNLRKARRVSVATGTSTFDIEGVGPIAWHADHRPFSSWAVGGPEELEIFFQQARQPRPLS